MSKLRLKPFIKSHLAAIIQSFIDILIVAVGIFLLKLYPQWHIAVYIICGLLIIVVNMLLAKLSSGDLTSITELVRDIVQGKESLQRKLHFRNKGQAAGLVNLIQELLQKLHDMVVSIIKNTNSVANSGDLLAESVSNATDKIAHTIKSIRSVEEKVKNQSQIVLETEETMNELLRQLTDIHSSITRQSEQIEDSGNRIKYLVDSIKEIAGFSHEAEKTASSLREVAREGNESVESEIGRAHV